MPTPPLRPAPRPLLIRQHNPIHTRVPSTTRIVLQPHPAPPARPAPPAPPANPAPPARPANPAPAPATLPRGRAGVVSPHKHNLSLPRHQPRSGNVIKPTDLTPAELTRLRDLRGKGTGRALVILGNGPSLGEVDLTSLLGLSQVDLLSINRPDPRVWPTPYWAFCDLSQYRRHHDLLKVYTGTLLNSSSIPPVGPHQVRIRNRANYGFSRDLESGYHIGRSTVYASMQSAYWLGFERVYILGCDMNPEGLNGQLWYYGVNPDVKPGARGPRFEAEASHYNHGATILTPEERSKYWFCSAFNPWDFPDKYNRLDHRVAVNHIQQFNRELGGY